MMFYWPIPDVNGWRDRTIASSVIGISHTVFIMSVIFFSWGLLARVLYARIRFGHANEYMAASKNN
jgi:ABC-type dipeptide/oligopeptide/nickel transport system permease subunit